MSLWYRFRVRLAPSSNVFSNVMSEWSLVRLFIINSCYVYIFFLNCRYWCIFQNGRHWCIFFNGPTQRSGLKTIKLPNIKLLIQSSYKRKASPGAIKVTLHSWQSGIRDNSKIWGKKFSLSECKFSQLFSATNKRLFGRYINKKQNYRKTTSFSNPDDTLMELLTQSGARRIV